ncbi:hypothetical protein BDV25DRAFT_148444 [Aspergillus avenaceus]|uniref:Uncharacterized protein n=1 Tax=Aspergillus avenaceus TaxID=36643 RepID=A0A5N6U5X6_ASPAV|nr:hypothetical protein BDV25DRAFT_148444 [Aspergillus avenaceus]
MYCPQLKVVAAVVCEQSYSSDIVTLCMLCSALCCLCWHSDILSTEAMLMRREKCAVRTPLSYSQISAIRPIYAEERHVEHCRVSGETQFVQTEGVILICRLASQQFLICSLVNRCAEVCNRTLYLYRYKPQCLELSVFGYPSHCLQFTGRIAIQGL